VTSAGISDNQAGIQALEDLKGKVPRLQKIIGDQGYKTTFIEHAQREYSWKVEPGRRSDCTKTRIGSGVCPPEKPLAAGRPVPSKGHSDG